MSEWTEQRVETLKTMWADGASASQIAARLGGVSRNAVVGKVHRLGLEGRKTVTRTSHSTVRRNIEKRRATAMKKQTRVSRMHAILCAAAEQFNPAESAAGDVARVKIHDLSNSHCRWPVGDPHSECFGYCGLEAFPSSSYCPTHAKRAMSTPMARQPVEFEPPKVSRFALLARA